MEVNSPALFRHFPKLESEIPWVSLIGKSTPVATLGGLSKRHGREIFIKREDATDLHRYGGNKVRNLEFILGDAKAQGAESLISAAPVGSNFIAALVAQAQKHSMKVHVEHFIPALTPQMKSHWSYSQAQGMAARYFKGRAGAVPAWLSARARSFGKNQAPYWVASGGSSVTGAMGHVSAALELVEQIESGEIPKPDLILVGVGTCGTMAGLTAGFLLSGLEVKLVGVRCVDAIVCNRYAVARLANKVLRRLGSTLQVRPQQIEIQEPIGFRGYGHPIHGAEDLSKEFFSEEGIRLDTTYTSKVASVLLSEAMPNQRVLYWHTFSPKALECGCFHARSAAPWERQVSGMAADLKGCV